MIKSTSKTNASNLPIGIFDSGVGGLSIAKAVSEQLPKENFIYVADSNYAPYGCSTIDKVKERSFRITQWLVDQNVKAIVVACNTATVNAIEELRKEFDLPIVGVEPAIKPAAQASINKSIGIFTTKATAENQRFKALVEQHKGNSEINIQPCPGLVELVESGEYDSIQAEELLKKYLLPLEEKNIDKLVLGCTHYPFLSEQINKLTQNSIELVETATPVTKQLKRRLSECGILSTISKAGVNRFYSTKANSELEITMQALWKGEIKLSPLPV